MRTDAEGPGEAHDALLLHVLDSAARLQQAVPDAVLEAVEATDGRVTNRVTPHEIILGRLGDVEAGVRQLRRRRPLDVDGLAERAGVEQAAQVLLDVDGWYEDQRSAAGLGGGVHDQLVRQLADLRPADTRVVDQLPRYEGLARRWHDWDEVRAACAALAATMLEGAP